MSVVIVGVAELAAAADLVGVFALVGVAEVAKPAGAA